MTKKYTIDKFIEKANKKHLNKYYYHKSVYKDSYTHLIVTCPEHGDWNVVPASHIAGAGCRGCMSDKFSVDRRGTKEDFVARASIIHNNKYDYSKVDFIGQKFHTDIICPEHGVFKMTPGNHLVGKGCVKCATNGYNSGKPGILYILKYNNLIKIGITNRKVEDRLRSINRTSSLNFEIIYCQSYQNGDIPKDKETLALRWLRSNYKSPVDEFDGSTECFYDADLDHLLNLIK